MTIAALLIVATSILQAPAATARATFDRAVAAFLDGRIGDSVEGFDQVVRLAPDAAPQLWQRGIALFYAGRFADCRAQFEQHRTVNPNDVENAAWHFLCVAHAESLERARAALLPVGADGRVPMRQVYDLLRGQLTPEQVLAAAGSTAAGMFYGHLYVGLYFDAAGDKARAREHIALAADDANAVVGGYMHAVARIHLRTLK